MASWKPAASVLAGWLAFHLGAATAAGPYLDRLQQAVTRPLPSVAEREVPRASRVWVPDRYVPRPDGAVVHVPGHWERPVSAGEAHVPPLVVCTPAGECALVPASTRPPADVRVGP
jgi:hypothetical protein